MQYHFVVYYNTETKEWRVDEDSENYFPNGVLFDDRVNEWKDADDEGKNIYESMFTRLIRVFDKAV